MDKNKKMDLPTKFFIFFMIAAVLLLGYFFMGSMMGTLISASA